MGIIMMILYWLTIIILVFFGWMALTSLWTWWLIKRSAKELEPEDFKEKSRNQQLVDTREHDTFVAGHIVGARNFPYFQLRQLEDSSLSKKRPLYVYSQDRASEARAANQFRKQGYKEIYILKGGYEAWEGRTKKSK